MTDLLTYFYTESPLHAGASDSDGIIDLPIQREANTRYPVVYGQSLKGALRQAASEQWSRDDVNAVFGSPVGEGGPTKPGLLSVGDAQLVALPVPTLRNTFAWVTSQVALGRLARKYKALSSVHRGARSGPTHPDSVPGLKDDALACHEDWNGQQAFGPVVLNVGTSQSAESTHPLRRWADRVSTDAFAAEHAFTPFREKFERDLVLVSSDAMSVLVEETTEVSVRVQLNEGKTVKNGPFHSEYLPSETILASMITLRPWPGKAEPDPDLLDLVVSLLHGTGTALHQVGGDETLGKGLVWTRLAGQDPRSEDGL